MSDAPHLQANFDRTRLSDSVYETLLVAIQSGQLRLVPWSARWPWPRSWT